MTTPDRMASMLAAMGNGLTLADAVKQGLVVNDEERDMWRKLRAETTAIEAKGGVVVIPVEPLV